MHKKPKSDFPLALNTAGHLEIFFLGAGAAFSRKLNNSNLLLVKGKTHLLVDFGFTGPSTLEIGAGLSPTDIQAVLPTHAHADHVGGIETLAQMHRHVTHTKPTMVITQEFQTFLWNQCLRGGLEHNEEQSLEFLDYFDVLRPMSHANHGFPTYEVNYGTMRLELFQTNHVSPWFPSFGLLVDDHVYISGDTRFNLPQISAYAARADVMFQDVSLQPSQTHATLDELRTLPEDIRKKMWLYHFDESCDERTFGDFAGCVRQYDTYVFPET